MMHLTLETLITYRDGMATDAEKSTFETHLTICSECMEIKRQLDSLETWLREVPFPEPPDNVVEHSINMFQPVMIPKNASRR
jgi:hypothetical protein